MSVKRARSRRENHLHDSVLPYFVCFCAERAREKKNRKRESGAQKKRKKITKKKERKKEEEKSNNHICPLRSIEGDKRQPNTNINFDAVHSSLQNIKELLFLFLHSDQNDKLIFT